MTSGTIVMLGAEAGSPPEQFVLEAQRAATLDLIRLVQSHLSTTIILSSPDVSWCSQDFDVMREVDPPGEPFHFGTRLADLIEKYELERVMYFGGGSAPLLDNQLMDMIAGFILNAGSSSGFASIPSHIVLASNRHSSDWACISQVHEALPFIRQQARDNSLAWVLGESGKYDVRIPAGLRPATSMDIDTPSDLAIVGAHPDCPTHLRDYLQNVDLGVIPVKGVVEAFRREASQVSIIGRVSPLAWQAVNKVTRCWIRVFAEERGMVASERVERGEVRSLLGELLKVKGA
ncbi:MAG TPA: hypothetical protein VJZ27_13730, partial [Aggregatilineales bacterium]|nr:hypothetical protein [Aggregatilineales bacterium]